MTHGLLDDGDDVVATRRQVRLISEEVAAEHCGVSKEQHADDHQALRDLIPKLQAYLDAIERRQKRWEKVKDTAIGTVVVGFISGIISLLAWVGHLIWQAIQNGQHPR